jgi:putative hydrolase of HD superfamily
MKKSKDLLNILNFLHQAEKLKLVLRHSWMSSGRRESVAEHSWRMALMAMVLSPKLEHKVKLEKVLQMAIIHDICEAYAGDHWGFKPTKKDKFLLEKKGLAKILKQTDKKFADLVMKLFVEFETGETNEAKFVRALDKLEVMIQHNEAKLKTWNKIEKTLNLTYGDSQSSYDLNLKQFRALVKMEAVKKLKEKT